MNHIESIGCLEAVSIIEVDVMIPHNFLVKMGMPANSQKSAGGALGVRLNALFERIIFGISDMLNLSDFKFAT